MRADSAPSEPNPQKEELAVEYGIYDPASGGRLIYSPQQADEPRIRQPLTERPYEGHELLPGPDPYITFGGDISCLDLHDPRSTPAGGGIDPPSTSDIGGLGKGDGEEQL